MMAAALADGTTVIENAAREPEIECLATLLERMGAWVEGAGTSRVTVEGRPRAARRRHRRHPRPHRGRARFMVAAAITGGCVRVHGARARSPGGVRHEAARGRRGGRRSTRAACRWRRNGHLAAIDVRTMPYPGFPTDLQAQMMALMTRAEGASTFTETIFENRMLHAASWSGWAPTSGSTATPPSCAARPSCRARR